MSKTGDYAIDVANKYLEELQVKATKLKTKSEKTPRYNRSQHLDSTRSDIAKTFVWGFFIVMASSVVVVCTYDLLIIFFAPGDKKDYVIQAKDAVVMISSIVGSPLGFVLGYYFKSES